MDRAQTLHLCERGRDEWNAWAMDLLARREEIPTHEYQTSASVVFSRQRFDKDQNFEGFIFPGEVKFINVRFEGGTSFEDARFEGRTWFRGATFEGQTSFTGATFEGRTWFVDATFEGTVSFRNTNFNDVSWFRNTMFQGRAEFQNVAFGDNASFLEATFEGRTSFRRMTFHKRAWFEGVTFREAVRFDTVRFNSTAWFGDARFEDSAIFRHASFEGRTSFAGAIFRGEARLGRATFRGGTSFERGVFTNLAWFDGTVFEGSSTFLGATFEGRAWFGNTTFKGDTGFWGAAFNGDAVFLKSRFEGAVYFAGINVSSTFVLGGATFQEIPTFNQAHFTQAPRLDDFTIRPSRLRSRLVAAAHTIYQAGFSARDQLQNVTHFVERRKDLSSRWSELKRLAVQRHDHQRELNFFRHELLARRWSVDRPWHTTFWTGCAYELFSGFGTSIGRPLLFWLGSVAIVMLVTLDIHDRYHRELPDRASGQCVEGTGQPLKAALQLSVHKAIFGAAISRGELDRLHACLFGFDPAPIGGADSSIRPRPIYPNSLTVLGFLEFVWSSVMLFLIGLALRNHYRIK